MNLSGARAIVTGGSAGIGAAIAQALVTRGASVVINGRDPARLRAAAARLGVRGVVGDVGRDAAAIVAESVEALGGLDILINNAGWGRRMPIETLDPEVFAEMWRTNVLGAALMTQHSIAHLRAAGRGSVVNIASTAAVRGYAQGSAYVATKFALAGMTQCWQAELRPQDIRVIQINPSEVQTGFGGSDPERPLHPGKLVAEDIAHTVIAALELNDRGLIPELTVFATNPWKSA
ncbi:MAG: SDR family oxidoreductase [Planctomycetota bacterium]